MRADIRPANVTDGDQIAEIHIAVWRTTYRSLIPQQVLDRLSVSERAARWRTIISEATVYPVYVAIQDDQVIGFGCGGVARSGELGQEMEVYAIYVLEDFQHRGIGSELLKTIFRDFRAHAKTSAGCWVLRGNVTARRFYEKLGAQPTTERIDQLESFALDEVGYAWSDIDLVLTPSSEP